MNETITRERYRSCTLCPRMCRADRKNAVGFCGCGDTLRAARAALHKWEEPCLSGGENEPGGSGTVFFSGCTLRCCFCQNYQISSEAFGRDLSAARLAQIFLELQDQGAHNINLVTATQFLPDILCALDQVKSRLHIPVVYNCGGYERVETVRALKDYVDIWLPDFKYFDNRLAARYSKAPDYFETASAAILQMIEQTGAPRYRAAETDSSQAGDASGAPATNAAAEPAASTPLMEKGVIIRHMVLPSHRNDSIALLRWISEHFPKGQYLISLMSQYTPFYHSGEFPELNRRITSFEYNRVVDEAIALGLTEGFMQEKSSAKEEYTPPFDLEGL